MSVPLIVNGVTFNYPVQGDIHWGPVLTAWSTAVTTGMLQKAGGSFPLTAEVDFGTSFGINVLSLKSTTVPRAASGFLRMANAQAITWRNFTNAGDLPLTVDASNQLTFNGVAIGASASLTNGHIFVGNASNQPTDVAMTGDISITNAGVTAIGAGKIVNAQINASAAIALSKLAPTTAYYWYAADSGGVLSPLGVTASRAVITDANGLPSASSTTSTEIGYLAGATSAIQTQLDGKLNLTGGVMSGQINMASNRILSVGNGTSAGDAVAFNQVKLLQTVYASTTTTFATTSATYVQTNLSATITPTSASNRILIVASGVGVTANSANNLFFSISLNGVDVAGGTAISLFNNASAGTFPVTLQWVDSPASTSPLTYSVVIKSGTAGQSVTFGNGQYQTMLLQEIV